MPVPLVHQTDLFRPHQDPDDHWDLLCVHALDQLGLIDARAILIDHPPPHHGGKPDVPGMQMLSEITGVAPPFAVGSGFPFGDAAVESAAADLLIRVLETSSEPLTINIAGSCRDTAIACSRRPDLFAAKCCAIYLNAGTGYAASSQDDEVEYNVKLDVAAYVSVFNAPCQVYWCPCFERLGVGLKTHSHGSRFTFRQDEILDHLAPQLRGYLAYMFSRETSPEWRRWLDPDCHEPVIARQRGVTRQMWTTAGLLHAAGCGQDKGFAFEPIEVACRDNGTTTWRPAAGESNVWKLRIDDHERYTMTMRDALRDLILGIDLTLA